jgi:hypothetical protein
MLKTQLDPVLWLSGEAVVEISNTGYSLTRS